jgi:hypothetical protein
VDPGHRLINKRGPGVVGPVCNDAAAISFMREENAPTATGVRIGLANQILRDSKLTRPWAAW